MRNPLTFENKERISSETQIIFNIYTPGSFIAMKFIASGKICSLDRTCDQNLDCVYSRMPLWSHETCSYSSRVYFLCVQVGVLWYYPACPVALRTLTSTLRASDTWFEVFTLELRRLIDSWRLTVLEIWWNKMILFDLRRSLVGEVSLSPLKDLPGPCSPLLMHVRESSYQLSSWGEGGCIQ